MAVKTKILAISGSLREASTNTLILKALQKQSPENIDFILYDGLPYLPHFNPDLDLPKAHPEVQKWRDQLNSSQGVFISSPEYAHGIPGSLKNALDWVVGSGELADKPLGLITASPSWIGPTWAQKSLEEVLRVMSAKLIDEACLNIVEARTKIDAEGNILKPEFAKELNQALQALAEVSSN